MELQTIVIQIIVVTADSAAARASVIRASASVVSDMAVSMARGRFVAESRPGASMTLHSVPLGRPSDDAHSGRLTTWRLQSSVVAMAASERASDVRTRTSPLNPLLTTHTRLDPHGSRVQLGMDLGLVATELPSGLLAASLQGAAGCRD